jgi:hypothetical protein
VKTSDLTALLLFLNVIVKRLVRVKQLNSQLTFILATDAYFKAIGTYVTDVGFCTDTRNEFVAWDYLNYKNRYGSKSRQCFFLPAEAKSPAVV